MFEKLKQRVRELEYNSHSHNSPEPTVTIKLKTPYKGKGYINTTQIFDPSVFGASRAVVGTFYDADRTEKTLPLKDAVQLLVDHFNLKYEDGSEVKPKLVK